MSCASVRGDAAPLPPRTQAGRLAEALTNYRNAGDSKRDRERRARDILFVLGIQIGGLSRRQVARMLRCRQSASRGALGKLRQHATTGPAPDFDGLSRVAPTADD